MVTEHAYKDRSMLLEEIRQGDRELLRRLYDDYREPFGRWAQKYYQCDEEVVGEAYQKAFIAFYYNVRDGKLVELSSTIKTYLFAIGKNMMREQMKSRTVAMDIVEERTALDEVDTSIMDQYEHHHAQSTVQNLLARIGEPCKTVLELFYFRGFSTESIASEMGYKTDQIAAKRKFICLKQLRTMMEATKSTDN